MQFHFTGKPKTDKSRHILKIFIKMKKIKFERKLSLKKETIASLNSEQMNKINGGNDPGAATWSLFCASKKCDAGPAATLANVTCNPANCPTQGCYSAVYC